MLQKKTNLWEADVIASKERLNNQALKRTGTKEMPQRQAAGIRGWLSW